MAIVAVTADALSLVAIPAVAEEKTRAAAEKHERAVQFFKRRG